MSCWLLTADCALGTGRSWRAQNKSHWYNMNMPLLPYGICVISTDSVCGMHKCMTFCVSCGTDTNMCKIYIHGPFFSHVCQLSPHPLYSPKGFVQRHHFACSYCTLSPLVVKMKQTLETTLKTSWENKLPLKVIFPLTLDTALCFTSKNSCAATVIRIGSCWMYYSWGDIFTDLSLYVCLRMCVSARQLSLQRWFCRAHSRSLKERSWMWAALPPPVIPLSRFGGGWATRSSTTLLSLRKRWDYTAHNIHKPEIYLSK